MTAGITVLKPHTKDLGDFEVRRLLPGFPDKMVGPFIFFDHMGPADFAPGQGMPKAHEATAPSFTHLSKSSLPVIERPGVHMRLIAGTAYGQRAPTPTFSEMFYLAVEMDAGAACEFPAEHAQRAAYVVAGEVSIAGEPVAPFHMAVLGAGAVEVRATTAARLMLLGGAPMEGDRLIWWNFVASSQEMIDEAKTRWREQRFARVPDETEFIPLPDQ